MRWSAEQLLQYQQRYLQAVRPVVPVKNEAPVALEHDEQVAFVQWLRLMGVRHNATPNGGHRAAKTAKWLKAEGVTAGFPDITVWPEIGSGLPVLHVEMKRVRGGRSTPDQLDWKDYLNSLGGHVAEICDGAGEAIKFVCTAWRKENWASHLFVARKDQ
jgi:hypothetical protein